MTQRTIRDLAERDVATLQAIDTEAHGAPWSHRTFADEIARPDRIHLVAERSGELVGHAAAWIDDSCCRITNVAVATGEAGQGHASALLLALLNEALTHRRVTTIQLEVRPSNRRAQRLYSRFGFMPVGIDRNFYDRSDDQGSTDALVMAVADVCAAPWRDRLQQLDGDNDTGAAA